MGSKRVRHDLVTKQQQQSTPLDECFHTHSIPDPYQSGYSVAITQKVSSCLFPVSLYPSPSEIIITTDEVCLLGHFV